MKWAGVTGGLIVAALVIGALSGFVVGRRSQEGKTEVREVRVVQTVVVPGPTKVVTVEVPGPTKVVTVVVPAPTEARAVETPAPAAWQECYGNQDCLNGQCPALLAAPEGALTDEIGECLRWWGNLPSADPRRDVDLERINAELCKRGGETQWERTSLPYDVFARGCP